MGFLSFQQELAIDLGTANTIIVHNDKVVVNEPSIVAIDAHTGKMIAIGEKARQMHGKTHENIKTIRPLRDGVIADFDAAEQMIRGMIKMINTGSRLFTPSLKMVVSIPSGCTEVERRAVRDSSEHAGGRDVFMIYEPMAAAIGIGIDVEAPQGSMVVDIGGGTTEIAVIALSGANRSIIAWNTIGDSTFATAGDIDIEAAAVVLESNIISGDMNFVGSGNFFGNNRIRGMFSGSAGQVDWGGNVTY